MAHLLGVWKPKVLVVDDSPELLRRVQGLLAHQEYQLEVASSPRLGLQVLLGRLPEERPEFVLTRIDQAGSRAAPFVEELRSHPELASLEVLLYAAPAEASGSSRELSRARASGYLKGAVELADLSASLARRVRADRARRRLDAAKEAVERRGAPASRRLKRWARRRVEEEPSSAASAARSRERLKAELRKEDATDSEIRDLLDLESGIRSLGDEDMGSLQSWIRDQLDSGIQDAPDGADPRIDRDSPEYRTLFGRQADAPGSGRRGTPRPAPSRPSRAPDEPDS